MRPQLSWRKALPLILLLCFVFIVSFLVCVNILRKQNLNHWQAHLTNLAHQISIETGDLFDDSNTTLALERIKYQYEQNGDISLEWLNTEGGLLEAGPQRQDTKFKLTSTQLEKILAEGKSAWTDRTYLFASSTIKDVDRLVIGFVLLKAPLSSFDFDLKSLWYLGGVSLFATLLLAVLILSIINEQAHKPVERLTIAVEQMRLGNFKHLDFPDDSREIAELTKTIKELAFYLDDRIDTLANEHTKLSAVLNQMSDGVLIADPDGRVQLLNPAAQRLFQINGNEGLGRPVLEILRYQQLIDLWRIAKDGQRESTMLEIGSQRLFLQVTGMPLKTLTKGTTLILFQNLTQVRRLETVRRDFISNVSHELRTPLASMKALAETLQEGALEDPPAARRFITRMETEIDSLTLLVNELLELSRIESGKVPLAFHRTQPCELLITAYERMVLQCERSGLSLILDCPENLPLIFADTNRISQVIINLIHNATKFTAPDGEIRISAYQDGEFVIFYVKDTGVGMPKEDLARIFERFYKADRARTSGGTGLGLSIARHMVESHGGIIWAESEEGVGSTIYFSLPIA